MKRKGLSLLARSRSLALLAVAAAGAKSSKQSATTISGAGSTFVSPLVSVWTPALGIAFDYTVQYSADRLGRRHPGDHEPHGRLRRLRRAADARPVHRLQRLRPDPVGARRHGDRLQRPGPHVPKNMNLKLSGDVIAKIYMGEITNWNDPAIKELNPKATLPDLKITPVYRTGNSGTTYNFTDYLAAGQPGLEVEVRHRTVGHLADRRRRQRLGRRRRRRREHAGRDLLRRHRRSRSRASSASRRSRTRPGSSSTRASATSRPPARGDEGAGEQRAAHRQPAEVAADRVPDRDLHLHHPPDEVVEGGRAAEDGLLGADAGPEDGSTRRSSGSRRSRRSCSSRPRRR